MGASGYSGAEVIRYLSIHPAVEVACVAAGTTAGSALDDVLPNLGAGSNLVLASLDDAKRAPVDVVFSCLPSGQLGEVAPDARVIDLSDDHRADASWVYGLPEFGRDHLADARSIANPGCYPTATLLCLVPFARVGLMTGPVIVDAMSGTSGAGRKGADHLLHAAIHGSVTAYGNVLHRHVPEMERGLATFGSFETTVSFTPHLAPMSRGLLVTARARLTATVTDSDVTEILSDAYEGEPFISVVEGWPSTKSVAGSNRAVVSARVDARAGMLICSAAIDNLGKGAAGQAVQNVNLALGLGETTGLEGPGVWP